MDAPCYTEFHVSSVPQNAEKHKNSLANSDDMTLTLGQTTIIEYLLKDVKYARSSFLQFIEQTL